MNDLLLAHKPSIALSTNDRQEAVGYGWEIGELNTNLCNKEEADKAVYVLEKNGFAVSISNPTSRRYVLITINLTHVKTEDGIDYFTK